MGAFLVLKFIINWWANRSFVIRIGFPLIILIIAGIMFLYGELCIPAWVIGGVLLMFSGKSKSENNGYGF